MWKILSIIALILIVVRRWRRRKINAVYNQLKSNYPCWPILGHAYKFFGNDEDQMNGFIQFGREAIKKDGIGAFTVGDVNFITLVDPVLIEFVLKYCLEKGYIMKFARAAIGNGSVFAPVSIWRPRRKILAPTFSRKNLYQFVDIFAQQSSVMVERLRPAVGAGLFSLWSYITTYSMDAVCETTLGVQVHAQRDPNHPFLANFDKGTKLIATRIVSPWQHNDVVYRFLPSYQALQKIKHTVFGFIDQIIQKKKNAMKNEQERTEKNSNSVTHDLEDNGAKQSDVKSFLELLIQLSRDEGCGYSDLELQEETLMLVMAGTDTSAVGAAFTTLMLARHFDVQDKVYKELKEVFGDSKRPVVAEDLPHLKYLDAVIRESVRLYPPVPVIVREIQSDVTLPSGVTLVKDCTVMVNIWATHRNPRYWGDDAELFRPERFLDTPLKHPAQFMAFSNGPRNCLGYQYAMMSMKTVLATLLRHYRVLPPPAAPSRGDCPANAHTARGEHKPIRLKFDIMMKDVDNFIVELEPRVR